jgi:hypothetical protein
MCWHIGHKYHGPTAGLVAAAFFAVSPWAVIYSRKIWAQDFVPVFATATMWAVHALAIGKKPKAIFWCVLLPLCVVQIHFSGLALTAAVLAIVAWLRPKIDWRFAGAGLTAAIIVMLPYLWLQQQTGWADFKQARQAIGGGQQWEQLHGITTHPVTGYRLPSQQHISYALAIMNGGRIEDVLGIGAAPEFDRAQVWARKPGVHKYFMAILRLGEWPLLLQRLAFVAALVWLAVVATRGVKKFRVEDSMARAAWILALWVVVPLAVFFVTGLWTYLTYFVILYPAHFLACGACVEKIKPQRVTAYVAVALAAANVMFMLDYYHFVQENGGAQGTFGSGLGWKQQASRFLSEQGGVELRDECKLQMALATARSPEERGALAQKLGQPMLIELNHEGKPELPQLEWPLLMAQQPQGTNVLATNTVILLVDGNREALQPAQWQQLEQLPKTNFGPIRIYIANR